ncbi:hypothetical protein CLOP_g10123 [Closterium sp. NIES-67]|nr:hypothetical protein CLOP_g10123 [Closterium sp. NIES-67]
MKGGGWSKGTRGMRGMDQQHQYQQHVANMPTGRAPYESMDMPNMGMESRDYGQEAAAWVDENGNEECGPVAVKKSRVSSNMGSSTWEMNRQEIKRSRTGEETLYDGQGRSAIPDLQSRSKPEVKRESGFYDSGAWSNGVLSDRNPNFANGANVANVGNGRDVEVNDVEEGEEEEEAEEEDDLAAEPFLDHSLEFAPNVLSSMVKGDAGDADGDRANLGGIDDWEQEEREKAREWEKERAWGRGGKEEEEEEEEAVLRAVGGPGPPHRGPNRDSYSPRDSQRYSQRYSQRDSRSYSQSYSNSQSQGGDNSGRGCAGTTPSAPPVSAMSSGPPARAAPGAPTRAAPQPQRPEAGGSGSASARGEREGAESLGGSSAGWSGGRSAVGLGRESALRLSTVREESGATMESPSQASQRTERGGGDTPLSPHTPATPHRFTAHSQPPAPEPILLASADERWSATVAYDACVRMCMEEAPKGSPHAHFFLSESACGSLRTFFGLQPLMLVPVSVRAAADEGSNRPAAGGGGGGGARDGDEREQGGVCASPLEGFKSSPLSPYGNSSARKKKGGIGTLKLQVRKVRMAGKGEEGRAAAGQREADFQGGAGGSVSASAGGAVSSMMRQIKGGMANLRGLAAEATTAAPEGVLVTVRCRSEEASEAQRVNPNTHHCINLPVESDRQEVVVEVHDRSGCRGQATVAAAVLMDEGHPFTHVSLSQRCHWVAVRDTCQQEVARVQIAVSLVHSAKDYGTQCHPISESAAYDWVLAAAMAAQGFHARNLRLSGPWEWLCDQFAVCYGVSPHYTKLRYLTRVMDVATPTADCLCLIHQLLAPVLHAHDTDGSSVTKQEARMLADMEERVGDLLQLTFESYKSLNESAPSGIVDSSRSAAHLCASLGRSLVGAEAAALVAPAIPPAVQLFGLLNDLLLPEVQQQFCGYLQTAARRRCRQHLSETDEYVNGTSALMGAGGSTTHGQGGHGQGQAGMGCSPGGGRGRGGVGGVGGGGIRFVDGRDMEGQREAYVSMRLACVAMWREVQADIGIHNQHILPSFVDLPELTAGVYMVELQRRVNQFLLAVPPQHPLPHVKNLLHATADVEDRLLLWGVGKVPGGLDARELFGVYVEAWIRERTHTLMDVCRAPKWAVLAPMSDRNATSPFMEEVYGAVNSLLDELDSVLGRWPQYTLLVEEAVCDVERAAISSLASHFQNFLLLLNTPSSSASSTSTKKKILSMLSRRRPTLAYQVPIELGVYLNTIKRMLETLRPTVELRMRKWVANTPPASLIRPPSATPPLPSGPQGGAPLLLPPLLPPC